MSMQNYASYFDYEYDLGRDVVAPALVDFGVPVDGRRILDVGCGEGGVLAGLADKHHFSALGIDYDAQMISKTRMVAGTRFEHADFYDHPFDEQFDLVLLRDVLEHCGDPPRFLARVASLLADGGAVYATYTPYLSPFGGHQHNGSGFFANVPWLQWLPEPWFLKLTAPQGNLYKEQSDLIDDLKQIRRTRLSTGHVMSICAAAGLRLQHSRAWIVRPDYRYKFGLRPLAWPASMPMVTATDALSTSVEMVLHSALGTAADSALQ